MVLESQSKITRKLVPAGWSDEAVDCINRLMLRKPSERLGYYGVEEVYQHPWFKDFDWDAFESKKMDAPFLPDTEEEDLY